VSVSAGWAVTLTRYMRSTSVLAMAAVHPGRGTLHCVISAEGPTPATHGMTEVASARSRAALTLDHYTDSCRTASVCVAGTLRALPE